MRHVGALWRRSIAFKGIVVVAGALALLPIAALSLRPGGRGHDAAAPPPLAASRPNAVGAPRAGADPGAAPPMDRTARGYVVARGVIVPLPPGQWVVVAQVLAPGPGGVESVFLAQMRRDKLSRAVLVQAGTRADESAAGFRRSAQCARPALLYAKTISNEEFGWQDCWTIGHDVSTRSERDTPPIIDAAIGELELRGVKFPPVLLWAFFRLADTRRYLDARYYFNPETDGITSKPASGEGSDWNRNAIHQYPDKIAYVEKLRAWAEAWHPSVRDGFQGL